MTGVIWMVQSVHYPMLGKVGTTFEECQSFHVSRMGPLVGPVMVMELGSAALLWWFGRGEPVWTAGLALLVVIWLSTFLIQVPKHNRLACGFDAGVHASLVRTNWLRTVLWSARAVMAAWVSIR